MPIVQEKKLASMNGEVSNSLLLSLDDEESFVVLERSTANDLSLVAETLPLALSQSVQNGPTSSFPQNSTYLSAEFNSSKISNQSKVEIDPVPIPYDTTSLSVSVEEIEKRLQEVLHENINLKENLYQTNLAMKQQLSTVRLLQDRALETQKNHQAKFEETKGLILKLGSEKSDLLEKIDRLEEDLNKFSSEKKEFDDKLIQLGEEHNKTKLENKELKETNLALGAEASKLLTENANLKKELSIVNETLRHSTMIEKERKTSLQPTAKEAELHELVDQLSRKLEAVERARRQQEFDIDKLQAQLARSTHELTETQRKLAHSQNAQSAQVVNNNSLHYGNILTKYESILKELKASIHEEQTRFNSLNSWLSMTDPSGTSAQFEISELRRLLGEEQIQSVARKEKMYQAVATIHELVADYQKLGEELEKVKADHAVKESHGLAYDEMQKKGFRERLDSLTAKLVEKEDALAISERHLVSLQEAVRLQNNEKGTGEASTLKEEVNHLVNKIAEKDEEIKAKDKELNALKTEIQKLRASCDTIAVLEEQAKIFQVDFEAERKSRESLVAEKERLLEDLRHLQRRNYELIEVLNKARPESRQEETVTLPRQHERSPSPPQPVRPQDEEVPPPRRFYCPNPECNLMFTTVEPLQLHVITCLKLDD